MMSALLVEERGMKSRKKSQPLLYLVSDGRIKFLFMKSFSKNSDIIFALPTRETLLCSL